jgi:hypothetical protein
MSRQKKLAELHARTDQDLITLLDRELERALTMPIHQGATPALFSRLEAVYTTVQNTLPMIRVAEERARLDAKLNRLRTALDCAERLSFTQTITASC